MRKMHPIWIGDGNIKRVMALGKCSSMGETFAAAIDAFDDGEIFFPFGAGKVPGKGDQYANPSKGVYSHLSLSGLIGKLTPDHERGILYSEVIEHLKLARDRLYPWIASFSDMSHEETMEVLRMAQVTPPVRQAERSNSKLKGLSVAESAWPPLELDWGAIASAAPGTIPPGLTFTAGG